MQAYQHVWMTHAKLGSSSKRVKEPFERYSYVSGSVLGLDIFQTIGSRLS